MLNVKHLKLHNLKYNIYFYCNLQQFLPDIVLFQQGRNEKAKDISLKYVTEGEIP